MSDTGRQSFTDKVESAVKVVPNRLVMFSRSNVVPPQPDSQKSTMENIGDNVKGTFDSAASTMQPNVRLAYFLCRSQAYFAFQSEKSTSQQAGDAVSGNSNDNQVRNL